MRKIIFSLLCFCVVVNQANPTPEKLKTVPENWIIEKVFGTENHFRILNQANGEYLYAAGDDYSYDAERRRVFTWTNSSTNPNSHPDYWDKTADWKITEEGNGFLIQNVKFSEYLFAAAEDHAYDEDNRSVFTWKTYHILGNEGYWKLSNNFREFMSNPAVRELNDVVITNARNKEQLKTGSFFNNTDTERRNIFTNRNTKGEETNPPESWTIEKVIGTDNHFQIKTQATGEYLYAAANDLKKDILRRRVFTWTNTSTSPQSDPEYWDKTADWEIFEEEQGFLIKNVRYSEYLYAAANDLAFDEDHRSVFTWEEYTNLGVEGYWRFSNNFRAFMDDPKVQVLNDVVITNVRHNEPLKTGSQFRSTDVDRRNIFTDRNASSQDQIWENDYIEVVPRIIVTSENYQSTYDDDINNSIDENSVENLPEYV